ncbi:MAG: Na+/H+ antiporter NhaC [Clostridium sp.]|uniref:Na+/H+ antiporter NhaC n=1 Tax=Clostridium sp. TaxID=1506 RepID=UPI00306CE5B4
MKEKQIPSFGYSLFTLLLLAAFMVVGMRFLGAPLNVVMFLAWILVNLMSLKLGYTYSELETKALDTVRNSLQAIVIMLAVGALIGVWVASGTVPSIVYYGMKIINAKYFLVTSLFLCSIVSMCTGTSWGTIGTVGVALVGVGTGLGIPVGMTAGAIISGSWFGDKLSPLSDTTNFASGIMGVNVMTHVKHMLYTTVPAVIVSAIIFLFLGFKVSSTAADFTLIEQISSGLMANFNISLITLIPMVLVIAMLLMRKPPAQSILTGVIAGIVIAIFYQGFEPKLVFNSFYSGFKKEFELEFLSTLLNRGGMNSMNSTVQAVIFTTGIGGMIKEIGIINVLVSKFAQKIKTTGGLVASAMSISYLSIGLTGSHCFAAIMVQSTMLDLFKFKGLKPENVSRICEDCGTIGVTIIPWGVTAVFIMNTLNIQFMEYAPYAFLCYLCPLFSLLCGITGIGMAKYTEEEKKELQIAS